MIMLTFDERLRLLEQELEKKTPDQVLAELQSHAAIGPNADEYCKTLVKSDG